MSPYVARHDIRPGVPTEQKIRETIAVADVFLAVLTSDGTGSSYVQQGIGAARGLGRREEETMYWLQRINQWSLVRSDDGWSCYEHDPDSAKLLGDGWGVIRDWQELPIVKHDDGWLGPRLPWEVPTEIAEGFLASAKTSGHGGPVVKPPP